VSAILFAVGGEKKPNGIAFQRRGGEMAKIERMLRLALLIKERRAVSIEEMCRACGVSDRTIYRYLKALGLVEVLAQNAAETRHLRSPGARSQTVRSTDLEMLSFVLEHNPLAGFRYMDRRLDAVRSLLEDFLGPLPNNAFFSTVENSGGGKTAGGADAEAALATFFQARALSGRVRLRLKGRRGPGKVYRPHGISVAGHRLTLLVAEPGRNRVVALDLDRVAAVEATA